MILAAPDLAGPGNLPKRAHRDGTAIAAAKRAKVDRDGSSRSCRLRTTHHRDDNSHRTESNRYSPPLERPHPGATTSFPIHKTDSHFVLLFPLSTQPKWNCSAASVSHTFTRT
jgi:hypothetical protein